MTKALSLASYFVRQNAGTYMITMVMINAKKNIYSTVVDIKKCLILYGGLKKFLQGNE